MKSPDGYDAYEPDNRPPPGIDPFAPVERGVWIPVAKGIPEEGETFFYLTRNKKVGVCSNRMLGEWFIRKYAVVYWAYPMEFPEEL